MAYQPIEMSGHNPLLEAMGQIGQSLGQLGDQRDRQAHDKEIRQRQDEQDYQGTLVQASAMMKSGNYEGAAALMAKYKGRLVQDHQDALAGGAPTQQAPGAQPGVPAPISPQVLPPGTPPDAGKVPPPGQGPPQGGSPMPDALEQSQNAPAPQRFGGQGPTESGAQPPPAPPPENPLFAAQAATKAKDQQKARTLLAFTPPGGQEQMFDPMAGMDRMRDRRLAQLDQAFTQSKDPIVAKYYPQVRAAVMSGDEDIKPMDALRYMHYMAATEQSGVNTDKRLEGQTANQDLNRGTRERGQDMTQQNSIQSGKDKITAASRVNPAGLKVDTGTRGDVNNLERAVKDQFSFADGKQLVKSDRALHAALANVAATGPDAVMAHKEAFMAMERYFRGAVPTESEQILLLKHMGGIHGAIEQYLADAATGDFSATTLRNLSYASKLALDEQQKNVQGFLGALQERLGPGSEFELMGSNVNKQVKSMGKLYGYDLPDLYPQAHGGLGQARLGAGTKARQPPATPKKGSAKSTEDYLKMLDTP